MAKDAKGHGSNGRGYRGKYPDRIHTISGAGRGVAHVRTNAGDKFHIHAKNTGGVMPKPGEGMDKYPHAEPLPKNDAQAAAQLASGPKSAPAPVHEAMNSSTHNSQGHAWGSSEALKDFSAQHNPKGFVSGRREIGRLRRQGK